MRIKVLEKSWFRLVLSSHYSAQIKRSQFEMETWLMKEFLLSWSCIVETNVADIGAGLAEQFFAN